MELQRYKAITAEDVIFPYNEKSVEVDSIEQIELFKSVANNGGRMVIVPKKADTGIAVSDVGVIVTISQIMSPFPNLAKVNLKADEDRVIVKEVFDNGEVSVSHDIVYENGAEIIELLALFKEARDSYEEFCDIQGYPRSAFSFDTLNEDLDEIVSSTPEINDPFKIFSSLNTHERLLAFLVEIKAAIEVAKIDERVAEKVKASIDQNQREYYVREQIRALSEEIGEEDECEHYYAKIDKLNVSDDVKAKLKRETIRLKRTAPASPEMALIKNYLDTVIELPWGVYTDDNEDLKEAERVLNEDHFGIEKVKERLIEALAVRKLSKEGRSPIICLVGPPGIGKTSIAQSIARAMNKKYVRLSFGGVRDEAEIRGHRKTYIGAMPGRIVTSIKTAGSMNPVFLMDEIDKMASDYKGDPASALLEVLDPEQNVNFRDHFLEVPFDLSKVLFITTANTLSTISRPLLDRMEIIEMTGYTELEKLEIAKRYLVRKALKNNGVSSEWVSVTDDALLDAINFYTRESGVRGLEKAVNKIMRKVARKFVDNPEREPIVVDRTNLIDYLGEPKYLPNKNDVADAGAVTGLAWTEVGGETMLIEVAYAKGKGEIQLTGNLGDVMKESARIAISYCRTHEKELGIEEEFFKKNDIHIHAPEGAVPKDGPSAGITIATAIVSAVTGRKVKKNVAMTGELTLHGKVLPIGGLREKSMAALRVGVKDVYLPEENRKDYKELPKTVKEKIAFHFVSRVTEVFDGVLL